VGDGAVSRDTEGGLLSRLDRLEPFSLGLDECLKPPVQRRVRGRTRRPTELGGDR